MYIYIYAYIIINMNRNINIDIYIYSIYCGIARVPGLQGCRKSRDDCAVLGLCIGMVGSPALLAAPL